LGLGLALAQPQREILVFAGDGSLSMNLGCLITVVASGATNISVVVLDNGRYEITGGQRTASGVAEVDFAGVARAAGFPNVAQFYDLQDWQRRAAHVLHDRGPRFLWLQIEPVTEDYQLDPPGPMQDQLTRLLAGLAGK